MNTPAKPPLRRSRDHDASHRPDNFESRLKTALNGAS